MTSSRTRINTPRLTLEPLGDAHADALFALYQDSAVARFLVTKPGSRNEFREVHRRALQFGDTHGMWAILPKEERTLIGRVGFFAFGEAARPELAFLLSSTASGRGYATEACRAALDRSLSAHPWTEVVAVVRPANTAAIRVLEKLGFSVETEMLLRGENAVLFQVERGEVRASRPTSGCS